ncbi:MAG TPA: 2-dehydropantoate 2-reductase [Anaerolineae bacterium]|nr:2-dehydropantoate 2-reductase [Anaerolineae bacterium]
MRIAIVGSGGAGGYYGALLARCGHEVIFIARGAHLEAIRARGLRILSVHGDFEVAPTRATADPAEIGAVDLTILAVKTYDTHAAALVMRPLVGPHTSVLSLQNGVESAAQLSRYFGRETVLGGATWIVSSIAEPGVIRQESQFRRIVLGELDGQQTQRVKDIRQALAEAGIAAEVSDHIDKVLWTKLLFIASFSGITSVTRAPAGPVRTCAESRLLLERAMREVEAVARAKGLDLDGDVVPKTLAFVETFEPTATSSMQRDVAAGRRLEYDALNGAVVRAGREAGIPTPVHEFIWTCLKVVDSMADRR